MTDKKAVLDVLGKVYDPDYKDKSVVDMGLIDEDSVSIAGQEIQLEYTLTAPLCPFSAAIGLMMKYAVETGLGGHVDVRLRSDHPQGRLVNEILQSPERCRDLFTKLRQLGILDRCVRI